jgi:hypothetical protein
MNTCGKQRAPLPVRKPKQTGVALRHAATPEKTNSRPPKVNQNGKGLP